MDRLLPLLFFASGSLTAAWLASRMSRREAVAAKLSHLGDPLWPGFGDGPSVDDRKARFPERGLLPVFLGPLTRLSSRFPLRPGESELEKADVRLSPGEFQSLRLLLLAALSFAALFLGGPFLLFASLPPAVILSWYLPHLMLRKRQTRRQEAISESLPEIMDLLTLLLYAGQGLNLALPRAASCSRGPLRDELERVFRSLELGMPRQEAFSHLEQRNDSEELHRFIRAVRRAERFGSPLASSIEYLAAEMRHRQKSRLQERAHKAPVKILFPLVFLILPSFLLLTVCGMILGGRFF